LTEPKEKNLTLEDLTTPQPDSTNPTYFAYVEKKIQQSQAEVRAGETLTEEVVWQELGIET
jgi:hypothetical protein